jgi:hypothetical protein
MRGTYHGPYPSRDEVRAALRASRESVGYGAPQYLRQPARDCAAVSTLYPPLESHPVVRCALIQDSTIVLGSEGIATLFDRETGTQYAHYRVE